MRNSIADFRCGRSPVLVATDVAARGLGIYILLKIIDLLFIEPVCANLINYFNVNCYELKSLRTLASLNSVLGFQKSLRSL